ncbi:hypothetical protein Nepgr_020132 [Nepenthes gracilis]|uniref:Pentatricopeptide repeat-containing protein n=1 Tax=Nepenthes gracilis TaxID=150966 RepID=A0AAD3SYJ3_NEPGR|nr:hypothetical protein Nepgr_020132 [Nepenthes gracilis]
MLAKRQLLQLAIESLPTRTTRKLTTCPLPIDSQTSSVSAAAINRQTLFFSFAEQLIQRGLHSPARVVIQRIISHCSSVRDVVSAVDFAIFRGLDLDTSTCSVLIRKFVDFDEIQLAEAFYHGEMLSRDIDSDPRISNSMVICYSKLGKLDEAKNCFERLLKLNPFPCRAACVVLLRELCAQGRPLEAYDYFIRSNYGGVVLGSWCFKMLIYNLCDKGCLDEALHVFDIMLERSESLPTANIYKSLFYGLCKQRRIVEAELFGGEMESHGFFIDRKMFTALIYGYCCGKKMKMAMRVYFRMLKTFCKPDIYTLNTLIDGFFKLGMFDKGRVLITQMEAAGMAPDVATHQIMISEYCRRGEVECALTLLNNMSARNLSPNIHCYTAVIDALYAGNRLVDVDEFYRNMVESQVVPDLVFFFKLLKKCPRGQELHLAHTILQAIVKNGCGIHPSSLSSSAAPHSTVDLKQEIGCLLDCITEINLDLASVAFGICISALCAGDKIDEALCCMHKMVSLGCQPLLSTYNSLIKCLLSRGLLKEVNSHVNLINIQGMVPNLDTYLILISGYCKRRDFESAFDILNQMDENGLKPGVAVYDSIINCLCREKRIYEAEDVFRRMLEGGVVPDEILYVTMINGLSKNGKAFEAGQLFDIMLEHGIPPSPRAYTALMYGLVKKNMIRKNYLDRMFEDGFVPNHVFFTSVINQFLRRGELEFSLKLVNLLYRCKIVRDHVTYITIVSGVSRNVIRGNRKHNLYMSERSKQMRKLLVNLLGQDTLVPWKKSMEVCYNLQIEMKCFAMRLMQEIRANGHMPSLYIYNSMIYGFCKENRMQDAYDHLESMQKEGLPPNHVTFTILIDGHIRHGEVDCALWLFNKMNEYGCKLDKIMYNTLIRGLCMAGRLPDALSVSVSMRKRGFCPSKDCYEKLLYLFCTLHLSAHAVKIFEEMLFCNYFPSKNICKRLLCTLYEEYKLHEASKVLEVVQKEQANRKLKKRRGFWLTLVRRQVPQVVLG